VADIAPRHPEVRATDVVDAFLGVSRVLVALAARSMAQLGVEVTLVQHRALVVLASAGPRRTTDLADELGVASSTVTRMCDRLTRKGLVRRYRRADDRRVSWVGLTEAGRDLVGEVMRHRREAIAQLVGSIALTDPGGLAEVLGAFARAAGELADAEWWRHWRVCADPDPAAVDG
jgi:DNA-binding MarR family transcriptional regulator